MTTPESFVHRPDHITESVGHQSAISIFTGGRQSVSHMSIPIQDGVQLLTENV